MSFMRDVDGNRLDTIDIKQRLDGAEQVADLIGGQFPIPDQRRLYGPLVGDAPTVNLNVAPNGAVYNQQYAITANELPAGWPVDVGDAPIVFAANFIGYTSTQPRLYRTMCDADKVVFRMSAGSSGQLAWGDFLLFVDGQPVSLTPTDPVAGASYTELVFADARPRLLEILTCGLFNGVYCPKPYRCWMPPVQAGLKALLVGDSYSAGVTSTGPGAFGDCLQGFSSRLGMELGVARWSTDAVGGTGFIRTSDGAGANDDNYNDRRAEHITRAPDALILLNCGANDLYGGNSVPSIVAAAVDYFTEAREGLPSTKFIITEGFAPPVGFSSFNDEYASIRAALQTELADVGAYYIDVATSSAWLDGSGYVGNTTGVGNSDIYTGNDGAHPSPAGHRYILKRMAPKIRTALADNGDLLNTLI